MTVDPRSKWLLENNAALRAAFERLTSKCLDKICLSHQLPEVLCIGDYEFLLAMNNIGEPAVSMAQIARILHVNPSSATRRTRRLLACGLVTKETDAADERRYLICLTESGRLFWKSVEKEIYNIMEVMFENVTVEEREKVLSMTSKCLANLNRLLEE